MKTSLMFVFSLLLVFSVNGQTKSQTMEVSSGDILNDMVVNEIQYAFDEFSDGTVFFKKGVTNNGKLNYNYLLGEMQFIDPVKNEILTLTGIDDVIMITISNRQFIPLGGGSEFMELLTKGDTRLAVRRKGKSLSMGKTGAYGMVSATSSISSYSHISAEGQTQSLSIKENIRVSLDNTYYLFSNGKKEFVKGVKSFTKVYPKSGTSLIEKYVADNKIDFKKESDIISLIDYCNQL